MEQLTKPRKGAIRRILEHTNKNGILNSNISYNDLLFLAIIQTTGLDQYTERIQKQLNLIRKGYIKNRVDNDYNHDLPNLTKYDVTDPFRVAVVCENLKDFQVEIVDILRKSFGCNNVKLTRIRVEDMFEFHAINTSGSLRGWRFDGYIETKTAYKNSEYNQIQYILPTSFIT
jgi:hypothetical protein